MHAHNVQPALGWRALAAARDAGARVVLHLHNYRLVCAVGTCFTRGADCTRCHGRNTLPGVRLNCRGGSRAESAAYGAGLALWQRRVAGAADAFVVPSAFALRRLRALGAPLGGRARVIPSVQRAFADALAGGRGRVRAVRRAARGGEGRRGRDRGLPRGGRPARGGGRRAGRGGAPCAPPPAPTVRFTGRVDAGALAELRAGAALALVPSRYEEILPLAALEAMAAGLPVVASRAGGLAELVPEPGLHRAGRRRRDGRSHQHAVARRRRRRGRARGRARAHGPARCGRRPAYGL